ncbi:MAG: SsrA-binding protein SmpB [Phycisphaerales bacterium]|jgi:SsrA-binding protein|nr:SsrA-binding protein SmpB [Phycisphaerales bacterium]
MAKKSTQSSSPTIENRRVRHEYAIQDTLEVGMVLVGSEVKSIRLGQASLAEGWVRASEHPPCLTLHGVHIAEYPNASPAHQHEPTRTRILLAHKREIKKLAKFSQQPGRTLVPLKLFFVKGRAKLLVGFATGKQRSDKRQDLAKRTATREMDRAMKRRLQ